MKAIMALGICMLLSACEDSFGLGRPLSPSVERDIARTHRAAWRDAVIQPSLEAQEKLDDLFARNPWWVTMPDELKGHVRHCLGPKTLFDYWAAVQRDPDASLPDMGEYFANFVDAAGAEEETDIDEMCLRTMAEVKKYVP